MHKQIFTLFQKMSAKELIRLNFHKNSDGMNNFDSFKLSILFTSMSTYMIFTLLLDFQSFSMEIKKIVFSTPASC